MSQTEVTVASLHCYPLKSAGPVDLDSAVIGERGFPFDRHWMLVDGEGRFVSQRQLPQMSLIAVALHNDRLEVSWPDSPSLEIPLDEPGTAPFQATMHASQQPLSVVDEGCAAGNWFTDILGEKTGHPLRLVRLAPGFEREIPDVELGRGAFINLADAYPYLVTSMRSLAAVVEHLGTSVSSFHMNRFRPNIVLHMEPPWSEMQGGTLRSNSGSAEFDLVKPCKRCGTPQVNQEIGQSDVGAELHHVLSELSAGLPVADNVFGQNAIVADGAGEELVIGQGLTFEPRPCKT
mgnify:CR=1 FL=1